MNTLDKHPGGNNFGTRKNIGRDILAARDYKKLAAWIKKNRAAVRSLSSLLFDHDEIIRWRAVEAIGIAAAVKAENNTEYVRNLIRRFFWMMNDESGNICWNAPEAIGEILRNNPLFIPKFAKMLVSFLNEEPFQSGVRLAISRAAEINPVPFKSSIEILEASLDDSDAAIRGLSLIALRTLSRHPREKLRQLAEDRNAFFVYNFSTGKIESLTVGGIAKDILKISTP